MEGREGKHGIGVREEEGGMAVRRRRREEEGREEIEGGEIVDGR